MSISLYAVDHQCNLARWYDKHSFGFSISWLVRAPTNWIMNGWIDAFKLMQTFSYHLIKGWLEMISVFSVMFYELFLLHACLWTQATQLKPHPLPHTREVAGMITDTRQNTLMEGVELPSQGKRVSWRWLLACTVLIETRWNLVDSIQGFLAVILGHMHSKLVLQEFLSPWLTRLVGNWNLNIASHNLFLPATYNSRHMHVSLQYAWLSSNGRRALPAPWPKELLQKNEFRL